MNEVSGLFTVSVLLLLVGSPGVASCFASSSGVLLSLKLGDCGVCCCGGVSDGTTNVLFGVVTREQTPPHPGIALAAVTATNSTWTYILG